MERKIKIVYKRLPDKIMEIESTLLYESKDVIVTTHILSGASSPIVIDGEAVLDNGYRAIFFEFCNEWHDIAKIYNREGKFTGYYCDINTPIKRFKGGYETLDLCLDLWIYPDRRTYMILDEDEFKEAVKNGWIDKKMAKKAQDTLTMLINQIHKGNFPPRFVSEFKTPGTKCYPQDWFSIAKKIMKKPGKVLVLGGSDTGKTAFCESLANQGYKAGLSVGVVDLDIGQSHIGPPETIGFGKLTQEIASLSDAAPLHLYEVGEISPSKNSLRLLDSLKELLYTVKNYDFDLLVIDSTGYIKGWVARKIKEEKINLIKPDYAIILEREHEMENLRRTLKEKNITIYDASVPKTVRKKTKAMRRKYRTESASKHTKDYQ